MSEQKVFEGTKIRASRIKVLDLFCCQGVGGSGYLTAGADVELLGVDLYPQPRNPHPFVQADALEYARQHGREFDFIHASPPCQKYSRTTAQFRQKGKDYPDLVGPTRDVLLSLGVPFVIENVPEAPLQNPVQLCGTLFGLMTTRHRHFEAHGFTLTAPPTCRHIYKTVKQGRMPAANEYISPTGHFTGVDYVRDMFEAPWANQYGLAQSIPPHYARWVFRQFLGENYDARFYDLARDSMCLPTPDL